MMSLSLEEGFWPELISGLLVTGDIVNFRDGYY
jgi:hypothetical protein